MTTPTKSTLSASDRFRRSMSAKLFALTACFVLLVEVLLLIPSVAKERVGWLNARIESAYLVSVALEAPDEGMMNQATADQLFETADIAGVTINKDGASYRIYASDTAGDTEIVSFIDMRRQNAVSMMGAAMASLFSSGDSLIAVKGAPAADKGELVDILVSQRALREGLQDYARNILLISLLISTVTAFLIYQTLNRLIVKPVKDLTRNMARFERAPEERSSLISLSGRLDEIGEAETGLMRLETRIQDLLYERKRLAALGAGISKISHDLRNILASAQLMSDRLAKSDDPRVRKLSPRLLSSLDRAITLSNDTVAYGKMAPDVLSKSAVDLQALTDEVFEDTATRHVTFKNNIPAGVKVSADKTHLYRAVFNIVRNAVEALAAPAPDEPSDGEQREIAIGLSESPGLLHIDIADNGPGMPEEARAHLFEPFKGSRKPGGSGLGIAIAHEIMRAHGGDLALAKSDKNGTTFRLTLRANDQPPSTVSTTPARQTPSRLGSAAP
ncbi:MAG: HAMP domain-containing sensor histidine kinase [Pseudomonadota bacterium]